MKNLFIFLIILSTLSFSKFKKECSDIKTGKFRYFDSSANEIIEARKDSIQINSCPNLGITYHSKIKWTSECNYEITVYKVNKPEFNLLLGTTFKFEILSVEKNQVKLKTKTVNGEKESVYNMEILE